MYVHTKALCIHRPGRSLLLANIAEANRLAVRCDVQREKAVSATAKWHRSVLRVPLDVVLHLGDKRGLFSERVSTVSIIECIIIHTHVKIPNNNS